MLLAGLGAIAVLFTALFAAPLILGSYAVVQGASRRVRLAWFAFLTLLLVATLALGALSLLALVL